jgi:X8 domain
MPFPFLPLSQNSQFVLNPSLRQSLFLSQKIYIKKEMRNPTLLIFSLMLTSAFAAEKQTERDGSVAAGELWCVAKNNAEDTALQAAVDWACGTGGADCRPVQQGGAFEPEDIQSHASYAFNDYFVKNGGLQSACDFSGTAALTSLNPGLLI